jgi:hypothetical protein
MHVGDRQDMIVAGFDAPAMIHDGGYKSANVVLRYVENGPTKALHDRKCWAIGSERSAHS